MTKYKENNFDAAIADFDNAIRLDPRHIESYKFRGLARHKQGDFKEAIQNFNKLIELNNNVPYVYFLIGKVYQKKIEQSPESGDDDLAVNAFKNAIKEFTKLIQSNNQLADAYYYRSYAYYNISENEKSIKDLKQYIKLEPESLRGKNAKHFLKYFERRINRHFLK
jgi:tetratricopeptide (TPR) repeat protein